ncbi:MAG: translocation/assembly module TamB domain-containing protein [Candidatus Nitrosoglobus sp.]
MRFLRAIGIFILLVLVLLIEGIAYLALTKAGTQWLFTQITHMVPGKLQVKQVEGRLGQNLTLTGLSYHTSNFTLKIEYLRFSWRPAALLKATFWVEQLYLRDVTWLQEHQSTEENTALPEIELPLKVVAESIRIQDLSMQSLESSPIVIDTITMRGSFDGEALRVAELGVAAPEGQLQVSGEIVPHGSYPLELAIQWRTPTARLGEVVGNGKIEGDLHQLTLYQKVQTPFQLRLRGRFFDLLNQPRWIAAIDVPETRLQRVSPQLLAVRFSLDLKGAGGLERFKIRGSYQVQGPKLGKLSGKLFGEQLAKGHWALHQLSLKQAQNQGYLAIHGDVTHKEGRSQLALEGQWENLVWPLTGMAVFSSEEGQILLNGSPADYRLKVKTALAGQNIPAGKWYLAGVGDTTQFKLEKLQGRLLDGTLAAEGIVGWKPSLIWNLQLAGKSLNPGVQWPQWPGKLAFNINTSGTLQEGVQRAIRLNIQTLSGSLRGYPVAAQGQVQLQNAIWRITNLKFHSGDSQFSVGGTVSKQLALDWQLISPNLSQLAPAARGNLRAKGHLGGQLKLPELILRLRGKKLAYQDFQVASITADVDLDPQGKRLSQLLLKATDVNVATQTFHFLNIQGSGTPLQHQLSLAVKAPKHSVSLEVDGAWKKTAWRGEIRKAQLTDTLMGHWEMIKPTLLAFSRNSMDLAPWCWRQQAAQLCLDGSWQQGKAWQGSFDMMDFPLAKLASLLPEKTTLEGTIAGKARVRGEAHQLMQARVRLSASAGRLIQATSEGQTLIFPYHGLQAKVHLGKEEGEASFRLLLAEPSAAPVSVLLHLPPAPLDLTSLNQLPLNGQISMAFGDLAFLGTLLPELQAAHGQLRVDLKLGGNITAPQLLGQVVLQKGSAQIPNLGLDLTGIQLQVNAGEAGRITLKGKVYSGQGQLILDGQGRLDPAAGWAANLTISGERFKAMDTPEATAFISPNLQIKVEKAGIHVMGKVVIPEATLMVKNIETRGGVPVSKDVVIISRKKKAVEKAKSIPIYAQVEIILGDKITVQAFGFKGGVAGSLLVTEIPGKPTTGSGVIHVAQKSKNQYQNQYQAYGQQLELRRGQVIFAGPIDNPQLNIEAVRRIDSDNVVVGVRIQGSASAPVSTLFSEPPMNESNILAYLVLGRPLTASSGGDNNQLLANAATSLGLAGGGFLAQSLIGKKLGLDVGVETINPGNTGNTQSSAFMIGKYLSPRLYIGYGVGILQRFNVFRIRYTLFKHLIIQAETGGIQTGADLFYDLER